MGRTGARLKELERKNEILFSITCRQIVLNSDLRQILDDYSRMLKDLVSDIEILKQSNFDYQIKLLSNNLDEAQQIIIALGNRLDELENTAWKRFCRWIGRK